MKKQSIWRFPVLVAVLMGALFSGCDCGGGEDPTNDAGVTDGGTGGTGGN